MLYRLAAGSLVPAGLTPQIQLGLGALVVVINIAVCGCLIRRYVQD